MAATYRREGKADGAPSSRFDGPLTTLRRVAGGRADTVYLLEDQMGEVVAIPEAGRPRSVARLPESLMEQLAARNRARLVALVGEEIARTSHSSYFKSFSSAPDGMLTALFNLDGVAGVIIDPATGAVSRLLVGDDPRVQAVM